MLKIAICDDDKMVCSELEKTINLFDKSIETVIYYSGERLCSSLADKHYYDLIFLDIEMENMNGISVGKEIREKLNNQDIQIVYISSKESYAIELFKVRTLDFLIKPIKEAEIIRNIKYVRNLLNRSQNFFEYSIDGSRNKIPINKILYFESIGRQLKIVSVDGCIVTYGKLYQVKSQVCCDEFVMVHRAFLVNFSFISKYNYAEITMINNDVIPISQQNRKQVRSCFFNLRSK